MLIHDLLAAGPTQSFEFFPPKTTEEASQLTSTLEELRPLQPSFVSVTNRGGAESRQRTFDLVTSIQREGHVTAMAHLICVGHTRRDLTEILRSYHADGVHNLMALGGDIPDDPALTGGDLRYALDLVELARSVGAFSIGVAAHPLGHPRSVDLVTDRDHLATKLAAADFAVTQFFFSANEWHSLVADVADRGVTKPIVPGIMPVTSLSSVPRMSQMGAAVPEDLVSRLEAAHAAGGPAAVRAAGIDAATELCQELLALGAPGLHFYTLNRSTATREIHARLGRVA